MTLFIQKKRKRRISGAGIIPYHISPNGDIWVLLQREYLPDAPFRDLIKCRFWKDYGGARDPTDINLFETALRELGEETNGSLFLVDPTVITDSDRDFIIARGYCTYFVQVYPLDVALLPQYEKTKWGNVQKEHGWFPLSQLPSFHPRLDPIRSYGLLKEIQRRYVRNQKPIMQPLLPSTRVAEKWESRATQQTNNAYIYQCNDSIDGNATLVS